MANRARLEQVIRELPASLARNTFYDPSTRTYCTVGFIAKLAGLPIEQLGPEDYLQVEQQVSRWLGIPLQSVIELEQLNDLGTIECDEHAEPVTREVGYRSRVLDYLQRLLQETPVPQELLTELRALYDYVDDQLLLAWEACECPQGPTGRHELPGCAYPRLMRIGQQLGGILSRLDEWAPGPAAPVADAEGSPAPSG